MTTARTATPTTSPRTSGSPTSADRPGVTAGRVVTAEWIKARGTRSTWWLAAAAAASTVMAGVSPALTVLLGGVPSDDTADPTGGALAGVSFTQLVIGALGVVVVTGEYPRGLIRSTFLAVPSRLPVLGAKALVAAAVTFAVSLVAVFATFVSAQLVLGAADVSISLAHPGVPRALVGAAALLALTAALGVGFGWLVRNTAGAVASLFGVLFVLPVLGLLLPQVNAYLPGNVGAAVLQVGPGGGPVGPLTGLALFAAYTAVVLATAASVLRRRDA